MFRQLAALFAPPPPPAPSGLVAAQQVLDLHPIQLSRYLEEVWAYSIFPRAGNMEIPVPGPLAVEQDPGILPLLPLANQGSYPPQMWDHLIYAYMVENTRVYEIFRRVIEEYAYGERLKVPLTADAQRWLRTTEQLFYSDSPPFQIYSLASWGRPDLRAMRRNAYFRLFGMDLNHGTDDNRPYPYVRAPESNTEFVRVFEELLRQVWRAVENVANAVGANPTDVSTIADLAQALHDMLAVRRLSFNLAREELWYVASMSWFHLTLSYDTPIVVSLQAQAPSAEERLRKIGERVGLPTHSRSHNYFELAEVLPPIVRQIEFGAYNGVPNAPLLFLPTLGLGVPNPTAADMQEIIAHWSMATGRDLKARRVSVAQPEPIPVRRQTVPIARTPGAPPTNGRAATTTETLPV